VEFSGGLTFDNFNTVVPPDAAQTYVYNLIAKDLVMKWLDGFDVDLIT